MATAKAITTAESAVQAADRAALHAHEALCKMTTRDPRTMSFAPDQERVAFQKADAVARAADAKADAARERLAKLRAGNGKAATGDARATLKAAIAEVGRADKAAAANRKGIERASELVRESRSAAERAATAVEKATERTAADAGRALLAGKSITVVNTALDKVRAKEKAAAEQADMAQVARENLESRQHELDGAAETAREKLGRAIDAVIKRELPLRRLLARTREVHDEYAGLLVILRRLLFERLVEGEDKSAVEVSMRALLPPHPDQGSPIDWNQTDAARAWAAMRQALADNADVPIKIGL